MSLKRFQTRRALATAMILGAAMILPYPGRAADAPPQGRDKVFVGYLYGPPTDINYTLYTHICHAFLVAEGDGRVRSSRQVPSRELTEAAHAAGVKVLLSLGGWGWDRQFAAIVEDPEAEERYVSSVVQIINDYDYDGIDFDWEYPDTDREVVGFERLTRRFRAALDEIGAAKGRGMVLTMAASSNPGTLRWLKTEFLLETMDWINVMTYDMAGDWTSYAGHHAPLHASTRHPEAARRSTEISMRYLVEERGLPPDRLAVGLPLYGRGFAVAEPYASTRNAPETRIPRGDYANLHRLLNEQNWARQWDDETKTPWLLAPDRTIVIGYDDAESLANKTRWAMEQGYRGVFFWQIRADRLPDGTNPLQEAAHAAWLEGGGGRSSSRRPVVP